MRLWLGLGLTMGMASGCTQANPAYGDDGRDGEVGHADTETDAGTSAEGETTRADATGGSEGTSAKTGDEDGLDEGTGIPADCTLPPGRFSMNVLDHNQGAVPVPCGANTSWTGILGLVTDGAMQVQACDTNTCPCEGLTELLSFELVDLPLPPVDFGGEDDELCVTVTVSHAPDSCELDWFSVVVSPRPGTNPGKRVIAASNILETELTMPLIGFGELRSPCDGAICSDTVAGWYELQFIQADLPTFAPDDNPIDVMIQVADVSGLYRVKALRAMVDAECEPHVGWVAVGEEG